MSAAATSDGKQFRAAAAPLFLFLVGLGIPLFLASVFFIVKGGPVAEVLEGDLLPHTVYDVGVPDNRAGPGVVPFPGVSGHYSPSA